MNSNEPKIKPLNRNIFVLLMVSALAGSIYKSMDNITVHNFIIAEDGLSAAFAYLVLGGWIGTFTGILLSIPFGRVVDPAFKGIIFKNRIMHKQAFISGGISAVSTLFVLWGNQFGDPSMIIALGSATIIYTSLYDVISGETSLRLIYAPVGFVLMGSILASMGGEFRVTIVGVFFVLIISNGLSAFAEIVEQSGVRASDGINLFIWRFFWLATTGTIMAFGVSVLRGQIELLLRTISEGLNYFPWIILTMIFVFCGIGLKLFAKKENAVTIVLLVISIKLIMAFPITLIGNTIRPGLFGHIPDEPWVWAIRMLGAVLIGMGILQLQKGHQDMKHN